MLDFLMEHDVILKCGDTGMCMTADEAFELGGEFVVYMDTQSPNDDYRGTDFDKALAVLEGRDE